MIEYKWININENIIPGIVEVGKQTRIARIKTLASPKQGSALDGNYRFVNEKNLNTQNLGNPNVDYISGVDITPPSGNPKIRLSTTDEVVSATGYYLYTFEEEGIYKIEYEIIVAHDWAGSNKYSVYHLTYLTTSLRNRFPLKPWTVTDVINRLCDVCEPIRKGETPRFRLNAEQAAEFQNIYAPQFSFTKQTLRECLQQVGKIVHGEPRLTPVYDEEQERWFYEITYDRYGGLEQSKIPSRPYVLQNVKQSINDYCSYLDSTVENLVNTLDSMAGVIKDPYDNGFKSLRIETSYGRLEETSLLILTQFPIYAVSKLECFIDKAIAKKGDSQLGASITVDITNFLFEKTVYGSQLQSYKGFFPYAKAYGIYFTQGEKNIEGLFFKEEQQTGFWKNYSILNILRKVTQIEDLKISNYKTLQFRVTYIPFYNSRIAQCKPNYSDFSQSALIYNQTANVIESRNYGENLKGVVARMGNVEKVVTYKLGRLALVPKAGQLFDENYYISTVAVEFMPTYIKVELGLSKDFNRLSQYIGINSEKRYSEVSQTQAQERNVLYREYIVVSEGDSNLTVPEGMLIGYGFMKALEKEFYDNTGADYRRPITNVVTWGYNATGESEDNDTNAVQLPVISSAFGNSISFSWTYEDNYSAGRRVFADGSNLYQGDVPYCDFYGRIYYYAFVLQPSGADPTLELAEQLPDYSGDVPPSSVHYLSTVGGEPLLLRKDNREILQVNVQIDFVSKDPDLIIGSGLAAFNTLVRGKKYFDPVYLVVLKRPINKSTSNLFEQGFDVKELTDIFVDEPERVCYPVFALYDSTSKKLHVIIADAPEGNFAANGKAWAIVTKWSSETKQVEDEFGEVVPYTTYHGGDVLLAKNMEITRGVTPTPTIYLTPQKKVFDDTVWKEKK